MKSLFDDISEIKKQIGKPGGAVLLLDFDGVLSDIAPTPDEAIISETAKRALSACAKKFPVVVISGRSLADVKKKVSLENISYSGNHGLEWQAFGEIPFSATPRPESILAATTFKEKLSTIFERFPGTFLEDKTLSMAIHYRKLDPFKVPSFTRETLRAARLCAKSGNFLIEHNKKTIELRPNDTWDKGKISLFFLEKLGSDKLPIYIGDSLTDEDAFLALKNIGLTIRVGKKKNSAAKYYLKNRAEVDKFLQWLTCL